MSRRRPVPPAHDPLTSAYPIYLRGVGLDLAGAPDAHPFDLPAVRALDGLQLRSPVTLLVGLRPMEYEDTEHYVITREFLNARERMLAELLEGT